MLLQDSRFPREFLNNRYDPGGLIFWGPFITLGFLYSSRDEFILLAHHHNKDKEGFAAFRKAQVLYMINSEVQIKIPL